MASFVVAPEVRCFICLANSYKRGGRCIAGIEIDSDNSIIYNKNGNPKWIRPIADTQYGEIPNDEAECIKLLSHVGLSNVEDIPRNVHREDVLYDSMELVSSKIFPQTKFLDKLVDKTHKSIFGNHGKAVSVDMASSLDYSLMFIHAENVRAYIDESRERAKIRMCFIYNDAEYDFPITDPVFLDKVRKNPELFDVIPNVYLTISLGLEYEGWYHKLVAGVIIPDDSLLSNSIEGVSYMEQQRALHTNAYVRWTPEEDELLTSLFKKKSIQELTHIFGRNEGGILARIKKLGLDNDTSAPHEQSNWFDEYESELVRLLDQRDEIEEQISQLRQIILEQMEKYGEEIVNSRSFSISYVPAKTVMQFDSRSFRAENEDLYSSYCSPKQREASIIVKRKRND